MKMLGSYANDDVCSIALGRNFSDEGEYDRHGFQEILLEIEELLERIRANYSLSGSAEAEQSKHGTRNRQGMPMYSNSVETSAQVRSAGQAFCTTRMQGGVSNQKLLAFDEQGENMRSTSLFVENQSSAESKMGASVAATVSGKSKSVGLCKKSRKALGFVQHGFGFFKPNRFVPTISSGGLSVSKCCRVAGGQKHPHSWHGLRLRHNRRKKQQRQLSRSTEVSAKRANTDITSGKVGSVGDSVVSSPFLAREVLKVQDLVFCNRPQLLAFKELLYNSTDVAYSPHGAYWRYAKKILTSEVLSAKRIQSYEFVRKEQLSRLVQRISTCYSQRLNLTKMIGRYANDVVCSIALGRNFSDEGEYDRHGFHEMLLEMEELLEGFSISEYFPSMQFVHVLTGYKSRLQKLFRCLDNFLNEIIEEHLDPQRERKRKKDLLDVLLSIEKDQNGEIPFTMSNVKANITVSLHLLIKFIAPK
ncbi:hypothetical protein Ancab_002117 [Ancistrocladus abbreviatus]